MIILIVNWSCLYNYWPLLLPPLCLLSQVITSGWNCCSVRVWQYPQLSWCSHTEGSPHSSLLFTRGHGVDLKRMGLYEIMKPVDIHPRKLKTKIKIIHFGGSLKNVHRSCFGFVIWGNRVHTVITGETRIWSIISIYEKLSDTIFSIFQIIAQHDFKTRNFLPVALSIKQMFLY